MYSVWCSLAHRRLWADGHSCCPRHLSHSPILAAAPVPFPPRRDLASVPFSAPIRSMWEPIFVSPCLAWPACRVWAGEGSSLFLSPPQGSSLFLGSVIFY